MIDDKDMMWNLMKSIYSNPVVVTSVDTSYIDSITYKEDTIVLDLDAYRYDRELVYL